VGSVDWMHLAEDRDQWLAPVNTVMNLRLPQKAGNVAELLLASQEGLCSTELVGMAVDL
jgi:hypothetical protein